MAANPAEAGPLADLPSGAPPGTPVAGQAGEGRLARAGETAGLGEPAGPGDPAACCGARTRGGPPCDAAPMGERAVPHPWRHQHRTAHHRGDGADGRGEDDARAAWAGGRAEAGGGDCRATSDRAGPVVVRGVGFAGVSAGGDGGSAGVAGAGIGGVAALVAFGGFVEFRNNPRVKRRGVYLRVKCREIRLRTGGGRTGCWGTGADRGDTDSARTSSGRAAGSAGRGCRPGAVAGGDRVCPRGEAGVTTEGGAVGRWRRA